MLRYKDFHFWVLVIMLQIISLRPLIKYIPDRYHIVIPVILMSCVFLAAIVYGNHTSPLFKFLDSIFVLILIFICLSVINYVGYPIADGLKAIGRGSDQDDALIDAGLRLISGENPYNGLTYLGNPPSPGPGWVILALLFTASHLYFLLTPFCVTLSAVMVGCITGSTRKANLFVILLMSSLGFWETMVVGSDLWAVGSLFLICVIALFGSLSGRWLSKVAVAVLVAMVVSSRIVFVYLVPLLGSFVWKHDKMDSMWFIMCSSMCLLAMHGLFYYWEPQLYAPLHLLGKGNGLLTGSLKWSWLLVSCAGICCALVATRDRIESWIISLWICLAIPLGFVSFGDLISRGYSLALWEGSNYLIVTMPLLAAFVCVERGKVVSNSHSALTKP